MVMAWVPTICRRLTLFWAEGVLRPALGATHQPRRHPRPRTLTVALVRSAWLPVKLQVWVSKFSVSTLSRALYSLYSYSFVPFLPPRGITYNPFLKFSSIIMTRHVMNTEINASCFFLEACFLQGCFRDNLGSLG